MDGEPGESFEGLMETGHDVSTGEEHFDPHAITHAMITPDGTTVPITLNPETGQFMTPDGQAVQVPMQSDQSSVVSDGNIQVLSSDGSMYFVTSDMAEASTQPTIQMMSTSEPPQSVPTIVDTQSIHG